MKIYWTNASCKTEALKYQNRAHFKKGSGGAYNFAKKNKILDIVCSHMIPIGNRFNRLIYVFSFSDNSVYVGLTKNITERAEKHFRDINSAVYKHIKNSGLNPTLTFSDYMLVSKAVLSEKETIEKYKNSGYTILNIAKAGAVGGGNLIWNFNNCKNEALKYKTRKEFSKNSNSAYNSARKNKWLNEICAHMFLKIKKPIHFWKKQECIKVALKCKTRMIFYKKYPGAYMACLKNNWSDEMFKHMTGKGKKPNNYWTMDRCKTEAMKFENKTQFQKKCGGAYRASLKNKWLNMFFK